MDLHLIFLIIAAVLFAIAALRVAIGKVELMAAGLFFLTLAFIF